MTGEPRFSVLENEIDIEALITEETCVYTMTALGYIKRVPTAVYRAQRRGGRGITGVTTREEDLVDTIFTASTHDVILFFTNYGRVYQLKGYQIPESSRTAKGMNIVNLLQLGGGERVSALIHVKDFSDDAYAFFVTRKGTVKRLAISMLQTMRKAGIRVIGLDEDDELVSVRLTDGNDRLILATKKGMGIRFSENEVRPMGRGCLRGEGNSPEERRLCHWRGKTARKRHAAYRYRERLRQTDRFRRNTRCITRGSSGSGSSQSDREDRRAGSY